MVKNSVSYPIYRKYEGNRSYFKITSPNNFTEIQVMGSRFFVHEINATTFPDFQLIVDIINLHNNHWVESTAEEFETAFTQYEEGLLYVK